jgi:peptidase M48-like protein
VVRFVASMRRTTAATRSLPSVDGVAVVADDAVYAFAAPGRHRRVVVSRGMLRLLSPAQQRALVAHERAHLRYRHVVFAQSARLAAAANPLLRPVVHAVETSLERWADAAAVRAVGNAAIVAHAVATAALAHNPVPVSALAAGQGEVVERVRDLLEPSNRRRRSYVLPALALLACWASASTVLLQVHHIIETVEALG